MISIFDKAFRYTRSEHTDIGKTIKRERKRLEAEAARKATEAAAAKVEVESIELEAQRKVRTIK